MEALVLALLMLAAVLLSSVIDQLVPKVSSPLIQIGLGLLIALFAPSQINITLDPDLFLVLFIAPLLFDEAKNVDKGALWKNRRPVLSLAIGLVVVTALIIGFAVEWLEPSIGLFAAFALGAALGPTDAVAVASLSKETDIAPRDKSILEGESLINDASGIVAFQFALAAATTGTFSLLNASSAASPSAWRSGTWATSSSGACARGGSRTPRSTCCSRFSRRSSCTSWPTSWARAASSPWWRRAW